MVVDALSHAPGVDQAAHQPRDAASAISIIHDIRSAVGQPHDGADGW